MSLRESYERAERRLREQLEDERVYTNCHRRDRLLELLTEPENTCVVLFVRTLVSKGGKMSVLELSCQVFPRSSLFIRIAPGFLANEKAWTMRHKTNE